MNNIEFKIYFHLIAMFLGLFCLILFQFTKYKRSTDELLCYSYLFFSIIYFSLRTLENSIDTLSYKTIYFDSITYFSSLSDYLSANRKSIIFSFFAYYFAKYFSFFFFKLFFCLINHFLLFKIVTKLNRFLGFQYKIVLLILFTLIFPYTSIQGGLIMNSISILILLLSTIYFFERKLMYCFLSIITSIMLHQSAFIYAIALITVITLRDLKLIYFKTAFMLNIILVYLGFYIFRYFDFELITEFNDIALLASDYKIGFKTSFILFNSFFFFLFWFLGSNKSKLFDFFYKLFIVLSIIFFQSFNIAFSDRVGLYSWVLIPIIIFTLLEKYEYINKQFIFLFSLLSILNIIVIIYA